MLFVLRHSNLRSLLRPAQAMRASLLASAIASTLWCSRLLAASIQGLSPCRSQLLGLISTTHAACTNRTRRLTARSSARYRGAATARSIVPRSARVIEDLAGDWRRLDAPARRQDVGRRGQDV